MASRKQRGGHSPSRRRRTTGRKPRWIFDAKDLDLIAKRRCLMVLSVLSGEKSVEEASREADITSPLYYQLEKKALTAMLASLVPGATKDGSPAPVLAQMEAKIQALEKTKRRLERLLFLTRMTVKPGPMTHGKRGRPRTRPASKDDGSTCSRRSTTKARKKKSTSAAPSTPTPDGADVP